MATKLISVRPNGRTRKYKTKPCTEQRIVALHIALGCTVKEAYTKLKFSNIRRESLSVNLVNC